MTEVMTAGRILRLVAVGGVTLGLVAATAARAGADPRIVDVSESAGIHDFTMTWSAEAGDINGDGSDDLLVATTTRSPRTCTSTRTTPPLHG